MKNSEVMMFKALAEIMVACHSSPKEVMQFARDFCELNNILVPDSFKEPEFEDSVTQFIHENVNRVDDDTNHRIKKLVMFHLYDEWCADNEIEPVKKRAFYNRMKSLGFRSIKTNEGAECFRGVAMRN